MPQCDAGQWGIRQLGIVALGCPARAVGNGFPSTILKNQINNTKLTLPGPPTRITAFVVISVSLLFYLPRSRTILSTQSKASADDAESAAASCPRVRVSLCLIEFVPHMMYSLFEFRLLLVCIIIEE